MEQTHVLGGGTERAPQDVAVGARERLPVGKGDVRVRGEEWAPRGAEVGARKRLPLGLSRVQLRGE